jgi:hypothetical protein
MDQKFNSPSPRLFANSPRRTRASFPPVVSISTLPARQHPPHNHPPEQSFGPHSLDLYFRPTVDVSHLDRQIIDNLTHRKAAATAR